MYRVKSTFSRFLLAVSVFAISGAAVAASITGAGATFPYPIYAKWADMYKRSTGVGMNYQSIGSGGGIKQITAKTVDFGASDKPLTPEELEKGGLMQFPAIIGGVVPVYNLKGVGDGELKFSGEVIADIFLGKIKKWNDPALVALNPGIPLPNDAIVVVHRSDGSGTTFLFTNYLSKASSDWQSRVGEGSAVKWPAGVGGKGNEGVASYVQKLNGAIGYVEYAYAKQNKLSVGQLRNLDGKFVMPSEETFQAAAAGARWAEAPGMYVVLTHQPGANSWPITGASFILMQKVQDKPATAKEVLKFFSWAFENGQKSASELDYVAMPDSVVKLIQSEWKKQIKDKSGKSVL
jgi:phosphate transport system substrate-binding protein